MKWDSVFRTCIWEKVSSQWSLQWPGMSRKLVRGLPRKSNVGFGKLQIAMNNLVDGASCKKQAYWYNKSHQDHISWYISHSLFALCLSTVGLGPMEIA